MKEESVAKAAKSIPKVIIIYLFNNFNYIVYEFGIVF